MILLASILFSPIFLTNAEEIGGGGHYHGSESNNSATSMFSFENVVVSLSLLCTIVLVAVGCTWAVWRRVFCFWRKPGTHEAPTDWFVPRSGSGAHNSFATLDPSQLGRDTRDRTSVTIDPLPSASDLGLDSRNSFELRKYKAPSVIPDTHHYSNDDWFREPYVSFSRANLEYQQVIGKGWFGKVIETEAINIKKYIRASNVIVRVLRDNATEEEQMKFLDEARVFREAQAQSSEHVLKLLGFCAEQLPFILIFEYFPLGNLKTYLKTKARETPSNFSASEDGMLTRMALDVIRGIKWMHQAGFVHGDLSARNCLVATPAGKVVVGDYGSSMQKFREDYYRVSGHAIPIRWTAPETLTFTTDSIEILRTTLEANIWTLAVVIWEIFQMGKTPYANLTDEDVVRRVITQKSFILEPPKFPFVRESTKDKLYQLLVSCWNSTPEHRPTVEGIEQVFITPV